VARTKWWLATLAVIAVMTADATADAAQQALTATSGASSSAAVASAAPVGDGGAEDIKVIVPLGKIAALKAKDDAQSYEAWKADFNQRSFEWHLLSTKAIFILVMGIVLFGLWLTWLQFTRDQRSETRRARRAALRHAEQPNDAAAAGASAVDHAPQTSPSSLKIGAAGVEISSQVIGLLILAFSLGFFYLYIKDVYPMQSGREALPVSSAASAPR
jgi:hypothetical protein